jgi:hypothetical protein
MYCKEENQEREIQKIKEYHVRKNLCYKETKKCDTCKYANQVD